MSSCTHFYSLKKQQLVLLSNRVLCLFSRPSGSIHSNNSLIVCLHCQFVLDNIQQFLSHHSEHSYYYKLINREVYCSECNLSLDAIADSRDQATAPGKRIAKFKTVIDEIICGISLTVEGQQRVSTNYLSNKNHSEAQISNKTLNQQHIPSVIQNIPQSHQIYNLPQIVFRKHSRPTQGLDNLGNTCYLNSVLQLLMSIKDFCSLYTSYVYTVDPTIRSQRKTDVGINLQGTQYCEFAKLSRPIEMFFGQVLQRPQNQWIQVKSKQSTQSQANRMYSYISNEIKNCRLNQTISQLIRDYHTQTQYPVDPQPTLNELSRLHNRYSQYQQQDAHQVLLTILDALSEGEMIGIYKYSSRPDKYERYKEIEKKIGRQKLTPIQKLFCGQLVTQMVCSNCGYQSLTYQVFFDLAVQINSTKNQTMLKEFVHRDYETSNNPKSHPHQFMPLSVRQNTLPLFLRSFFAQEVFLSGFACEGAQCRKGNIKQAQQQVAEGSKKSTKKNNKGVKGQNKVIEQTKQSIRDCPYRRRQFLHNIPPNLVISLKLFNSELRKVQMGGRNHLIGDQSMEPPLIVDWSSVCLMTEEEMLENEGKQSNKVIYILRGIVSHEGGSLFSGHYVYYERGNYINTANSNKSNKVANSSNLLGNSNFQWTKFNDSNVSIVSWNDVISNGDGYLLYYEKLEN